MNRSFVNFLPMRFSPLRKRLWCCLLIAGLALFSSSEIHHDRTDAGISAATSDSFQFGLVDQQQNASDIRVHHLAAISGTSYCNMMPAIHWSETVTAIGAGTEIFFNTLVSLHQRIQV